MKQKHTHSRAFTDLAEARERLGWSPRHTIREGLDRTLPYFRRKLGV